jgi:hypothetical protein
MIASHIAGDSLAFSVELADYPAPTWTLTYRLTPRVYGVARTITATASGAAHAVSVTAASTATWPAGDYTCSAYVTNVGGDRYTIASESGQFTVLPDPTTLAAGTDTRSRAVIALDNVKATLEGRATSAVLEYEISGRRLKYIPHTDLIALASQLEREVQREQRAADIAAGGGTSRGKVFVRMARA